MNGETRKQQGRQADRQIDNKTDKVQKDCVFPFISCQKRNIERKKKFFFGQ